MSKLIFGLFLACTALAAPVWNGEWGSLDPKTSIGRTLSIRGCETDACEANVFTKTEQGYCSMQSGKVLLKDEAHASVQSGGIQGKGCSFDIFREKDGSLSASKFENCSDNCTPSANFASSYPFIQKENFADPNDKKCLFAITNGAKAWCRSRKLRELYSSMQEAWYQLESFGEKQEDEDAWRSKQISACDSAKDAEACIEKAFSAKITELTERMKPIRSAYEDAGDPAEAKKQIAGLAGVYKKQFKSGDVEGNSYDAENILEIVAVDDKAIYFKTDLKFFNGHLCLLYGVAEFKKSGAFVYNSDDEPADRCVFVLRQEGKKIVFDDPTGNCKSQACGVRGGFRGEEFPLSKRRPIKYLPIILKSEEYTSSLKQYKGK